MENETKKKLPIGRQIILPDTLEEQLLNRVAHSDLDELIRMANAIWPRSEFRVEDDGSITENTY